MGRVSFEETDSPLQGPAAPSSAFPALGSSLVFDLDEATRKCFGRYELVRDMVGCLFDEGNPLIERMRAALARGEAAELAAAAHRLKGTVVYLAAPLAADATWRVEQIARSDDLAAAGEAIDALQGELERLKEALAEHGPERPSSIPLPQ